MSRPPRDPQDLEEAREVALRVLTAAPQTRVRLAEKLVRRGFAADVVEELLDRLERVGLVDDAAYARAYAHDRMAAGQSRRAVLASLARVGVPGALARDVFQDYDEKDESAAAREFAVRKLRTASSGLEPETVRRRLFAALARRGYDSQVAIDAVSHAMEHLPEQ